MKYVMSDLHGCYGKYKEMLSLIEFRREDTLYILGDVIDRGPDGVEILLDMMARPNVIPLLGNHEYMAAVCLPWLLEDVTGQSLDALDEEQLAFLQSWIANGGGPTLRALEALDRAGREDLLDYLREMELYVSLKVQGKRFLLMHSAPKPFDPKKKLKDYALKDFLFGRPDPDAVYFPDRLLISGHTPVSFLGGGNSIFHQKTWLDVDCGCVFRGGRLACLCLDTMEEFYV